MAVVATTALLLTAQTPRSAALAAPSSPPTLVAAALRAARSESGGESVLTYSGGGATLVQRTQMGRADGDQTIVGHSGNQTGHVQIVLLAGGTAYFKADQFGLHLEDFSTSASKAEADKWISLTPGTGSQKAEYRSVTLGLTVTSTISQIAISGPLHETGLSTVSAMEVVGLKGYAPPGYELKGTSEVLYVRATGAPLPVKVVQTYEADSQMWLFTHWGKVPTVVTPASSVPFKLSWLESAN